MSEWQPIDTAPELSGPVLLYARCVDAAASVIVVGWQANVQGDWIECCFWPNQARGLVPTHWQPLPATPDLNPTITKNTMSGEGA